MMNLPLLLLLLGFPSHATVGQLDSSGGALEKYGVCERQAEKLIGLKAVRIGKNIPPPKKIRTASPDHRPFPTTGPTRAGIWVGEVLIDQAGKIVHVWTIRQPTLHPPMPSFNEAIVEAVQKWEYEPLRVKGTARPVCMAVTVSINGG